MLLKSRYFWLQNTADQSVEYMKFAKYLSHQASDTDFVIGLDMASSSMWTTYTLHIYRRNRWRFQNKLLCVKIVTKVIPGSFIDFFVLQYLWHRISKVKLKLGIRKLTIN